MAQGMTYQEYTDLHKFFSQLVITEDVLDGQNSSVKVTYKFGNQTFTISPLFYHDEEVYVSYLKQIVTKEMVLDKSKHQWPTDSDNTNAIIDEMKNLLSDQNMRNEFGDFLHNLKAKITDCLKYGVSSKGWRPFYALNNNHWHDVVMFVQCCFENPNTISCSIDKGVEERIKSTIWGRLIYVWKNVDQAERTAFLGHYQFVRELMKYINMYQLELEVETAMKQTCDLVRNFGQIILSGPPGTGKTYRAKQIAAKMITEDPSQAENSESDFCKNDRFRVNMEPDANKKAIHYEGQWSIIQFHPSYNYEDFVRGIQVRTEINDQGKSDIIYESVNRILGHMSQAALIKWKEAKKEAKETLGENATTKAIENKAKESAEKFVLIIDEINRANLAAVLGELIYALEYRDEPVTTPYEVEVKNEEQKKKTTDLSIPPNLYIIGTMNTADRSIGHIDYAVRRRFAFIPCPPEGEVIKNYYQKGKIREKAVALFNATAKLFSDDYRSHDFHKDDVQVGHTYFLVDKSKNEEDMGNELALKFIYQVYPLLKEYYKDGIFRESKSIEIFIDGGPKINIKEHLDSEKVKELTEWCKP